MQAVQEETLKVDAVDTVPVESTVVEMPTEVVTVGKTLRAAREAARLSVEEVAQTLKFSPRQIELIETDNYAALPGNTIVRGFTRSYARLLRLDAEVLLRMLDARTPVAAADVRPPDNMGIADDSAAPRQFSLLASAAIVIALVAALLALWHFVGPALQMPSGNSTERASSAQAAAPAAVMPPAESVPATAVATPQTSNVPVTAPTAAESGAPVLKFVFNGRSWLEVVDAGKQTLHTGENPAGSELTLSGKPPFDIVVGNAARVKLTYGEREIDLAPYTRAEVARLKVE